MILGLDVKGDWDDTFKFLEKLESFDFRTSLEYIGKKGVEALKQATPKDSGLAANSWDYKINRFGTKSIEWHNYDVENGCNVVILIEYGHGLHQGGYVPPRPFINGALDPVFDSVVDELWEEVNLK